jgi:hypothetical protein
MTLPPPEICRRILALHESLGFQDGKDEKRAELLELLAEHGLSWNDLPELFVAMNAGTATPLPAPGSKSWEKHCRRIRQLHAAMGSLDKDGRSAQEKLVEQLGRQQLTWWSDLPAILAADWIHKNPISISAATSQASADAPQVNVLDLAMAVIGDRVVITPAQCLVMALCMLNTYKYDDFAVVPHLGIVSPASGHGKSTALKVLNSLAAEGYYSHHITSPVIYRYLRRTPRTAFFLDEGENQNLLNDKKLRAIIDAAYECDGSIDLIEYGEVVKFPLFCPIAYAIRGEVRDVPLAVLSRSFIINMKLATPKKRFNKSDPDLFVACKENQKWAKTCSLNLDPEIPAGLCRDPRLADNCRPLLAIADDLGRGAEARAALIELSASRPHQDVGGQALIDSLTACMALGVDRIAVKALAEALVGLENGFWDDWRGPNDQGQPHKLTPGELSRLLRRFGIRAQTVWPMPRLPNSKSFRGLYVKDIEKAWRAYCCETDTSTQPSKIIALVKP